MERHRLHGEFWRKALLWGSRRLPQPAKIVTMPLWAAIPFVAVPAARRQIARDLERILGPAPSVVGATRAYRVLLSFAQALANSYAAHGGRGIEVESDVSGEEHLQGAVAGRRGVILATGHIGPWQLGPYLIERAGYGPVVLAMAHDADADAQRLEDALRHRFRIVYTDGGDGPFASLELLRVLRDGALCAMQIDRPSGGPVRVAAPFVGARAWFAAGPAALARAAEAPILPCFLLARGPSHVHVEIGAPIRVARSDDPRADVTNATLELARRYEACVRQNPFQWYSFGGFFAE